MMPIKQRRHRAEPVRGQQRGKEGKVSRKKAMGKEKEGQATDTTTTYANKTYARDTDSRISSCHNNQQPLT
jgi:hypothetical protein